MVCMAKMREKAFSSGLQLSLQYLFTLFCIIIQGVLEVGLLMDKDWSAATLGEVTE